jgi:hypothetical protein|tara:strand:- start:119 stop:334 length:216 start_codon:yes stop_codon:yes gene_type:complete
MKDRNDSNTVDPFGVKQKPGPKPSGKALTRAQIQRNYRQRQRDRLAMLEQQQELLQGLLASCPAKTDVFED